MSRYWGYNKRPKNWKSLLKEVNQEYVDSSHDNNSHVIPEVLKPKHLLREVLKPKHVEPKLVQPKLVQPKLIQPKREPKREPKFDSSITHF